MTSDRRRSDAILTSCTLWDRLMRICHSKRTDRHDVGVTRAMCGADCWTYHRLVVSKVNLRIHPARRPHDKKAPNKRLGVSKLNQDSMRQAFLTNWMQPVSVQRTPKKNWAQLFKINDVVSKRFVLKQTILKVWSIKFIHLNFS